VVASRLLLDGAEVAADRLPSRPDALSYYADHQAEIQEHIGRNRVPDDVVHPLTRPDA
jgi:hypothetical protein